MNIIQFVALVAQMRAAQKEYYRYKTMPCLQKAIELEMRVDKIIKEGRFFLPQERITSVSIPQVEN